MWTSDGTEAGTVLVKDINVGTNGSGPYYLTALGESLYFVAYDTVHGNELWTSDGTSAGTKVIEVTTDTGIWKGSYPQYLTAFGNSLFFTAYDVTHGYELWKLASGPSFSVSAQSGKRAEGDSDETVIRFTLTLSEALDQEASVEWAVQGSGADPVDSADFVSGVLPTGTVTFAAGETSKTITIKVAGDTVYEPDEALQLVLLNPVGAGLGTATANVTIANDDPGFVITADAVSTAEGNTGVTPFTFTVNRVGSSSGSASVQWAVSGSGSDHATADDFSGNSLASGSLSFADGQTSQTLTVNVKGDTVVEPDEGFSVTLSDASGAAIGVGTASTTIRSDDTSFAISATDASKTEGNSGTTNFTFTVTRSGDTTGTGSVSWAVTGRGSDPAAAADFVGNALPSGTVSFAANQTTKTITVPVKGESLVERNEGFQVTISNPNGGSITQATADGVIDDDDFVGIALNLPGGGIVQFGLSSSDPLFAAFSTNGLSALVGQSSDAGTLYGLSNVILKIESVANGIATISGSGSLGGKAVTFSGQLSASNDLYSLSAVDGNLDLGDWLGDQLHFQNFSNGKLSLATGANGPQFAVQSDVEVRPDPDGQNSGLVFAASITDVVADANGISSFKATPTDLSTPFVLKLGEASFSVGRSPLTYNRNTDLSGYSLSIGGSGELSLPKADIPLSVDGKVDFHALFGTGGAIDSAATAADLEIVNTTPFNVAGTQFNGQGGMHFRYQEDAARRNGLLSLTGSNQVKLELIPNVKIELGNSTLDLAAALAGASALIRPSQWVLGDLHEAPSSLMAAAQSFDLGLAKISKIDIKAPSYQNRSTSTATAAAQEEDVQLAQALQGAGLFSLSPLYPTLQDHFTLLGLDGKPLTEIVLDISGSSSSGSTTLSRYQQLDDAEKYDLFIYQKAAAAKAEEDSGDVEIETIVDSFKSVFDDSPSLLQEYNAYTDYFKPQTIQTSYGTVTVNATGNWTYAFDNSKLSADQLQKLGSPTFFDVAPRVNVSTALTAELQDVDVTLSNLLLGMKSQATTALKFLSPFKTLVEGLETTIPLPDNDYLRNAILYLLEGVPGNAYKDGKLQAIELLDAAIYLGGNGAIQKNGGDKLENVSVPSITPFFKALGNTIRTLELLSGKTIPNGLASIDKLNLDLNFRGDVGADDPYRWLTQAYGYYNSLSQQFTGDLAGFVDDLQSSSRLKGKKEVDKSNAPAADGNKTVQGRFTKEVPEADLSLNLDLPPLYRPIEFITDFLTQDRVSAFELSAAFNIELELEKSIPTPFPPISGLIGVEGEASISLSLLSLLKSADLITLSTAVNAIVDNTSLSEAEKSQQISTLVSKALKAGLGTDLSKDSFEIEINPYLGLELGSSNYNVNAKLGLYGGYKLGAERVINGEAPQDQRIRFDDFYGARPTGTFGYDPTLASLRLDLNHDYSALLAKNSLDTSGFASFDAAYAKNSWLFNLEFRPLSLNALIGSSNVSYDKSLLAKLGDTSIDRINWISLPGSNLVTQEGVDLFFKDAKFLNSATSTALRTALQRQYPTLTPQELGRLLSLIVDNAEPTRISYALADAQNVQARIDQMQSSVSIRSAVDPNSNAYGTVAQGDRFRQRYLEDGQEIAVDSYAFYGLVQPKYVNVNAHLVSNYAEVQFDLVSEGKNIELELSYYDGSRWRPLGTLVDTVSGRPVITLADPTARSIGFSFSEPAKQAEPGALLQNSGTLSLQLSLSRMDDSGASSDEQLIRSLASSGKLQLRLSDPNNASAEGTYMGGVRLERGGAIFTDGSSSGAMLRQLPGASWSADLSSGIVQWVNPSNFDTLAQRKDLAFLSQSGIDRLAGIYQNLNPQAPLATLLAVQQLEGRSSTNPSASQSGALAAEEEGLMRMTQDPISGNTFKSYIGADRLVRIAMRTADGQDWQDIATLGDLQLASTETHAPDLVAVGGQLVVASWNAAGALVTYRIDTTTPTGKVAISQDLPALTSTGAVLAPSVTPGSHLNAFSSATTAAPSNGDLKIGLEKRLDLRSGSTSLQKAFYLSLIDPIQQVYGTSANALKLTLQDQPSAAGSTSLFEAAHAWADPNATASSFTQSDLEAQLKSLLGFGESSSSGQFSGAEPAGSPATLRAADFIEYASADQLKAHLGEWGSGSLFVLVGDSSGNGMVWNYDGDAYTRNNADRTQPESVLSSGRVYNLNGIDASSLSVVYKTLGQKDALVNNWQGVVDSASAEYRQVPGTTLRTAATHSVDDLVAGGNVSLLVTGTAKGLASAIQADASTAQVGGSFSSKYAYSDGTDVLRYISPERFADANGVYHWYDASNMAPLQLQAFSGSGLGSAEAATAKLNAGGTLGGLGWVWTTANPNSRGRLDGLDANTGLGFVDGHTLNLAITGPDLQAADLSSGSLRLQSDSLQLLPTRFSPALFFSSQGSSSPLSLSIEAGPLSSRGVVLHGEELLNPQALQDSRALDSFGVLGTFFDGSRPYLSSGDYVPLAFYNDGDSIYYGNLNAPVKLTLTSSLQPLGFSFASDNAVTPLGFRGAISDYISYGVLPSYGASVRQLIQSMPAVVDDSYFKFVDASFNPLNIGTILHAPMVPQFNSGNSNGKQTLIDDLTPWTADHLSLYVQGLRDISLGRDEPDSVVLNQLRLVGTYTEAAQSLQGFVDAAWKDPILKYGLLNKALAVDGFNNSLDWLHEFRKIYTGIDIPEALDLVTAAYPSLVNNTLFSPIASDAVISNFLNLPYTGPVSEDVLQLTHTLSAGATAKFGFNAWPASGTLASFKIPFFAPRTFTTKINSITSGPLMGQFITTLDENRDLITGRGELSKAVNQAFYQFDLSSRLDRILLDTTEQANLLWNGQAYVERPQNGIPDFRSGLVVTRPAGSGTVVDVMTGLANASTYLSRPDLSIADTHWESVKNAALLDYLPVSFIGVSSAVPSRWFASDPTANRTSLTKLVPQELESAFKAAFTLPSSFASNFNSVTHVYDAIARAATDPDNAPSDLLAQYSFENRVRMVTEVITRLYQGLTIKTDQLASPNNAAGYAPEIYAYQVFPYLALTLQGKTDPYYRQLLNLVAESVGTPEYAAAVAADGYKLDLSNASDIALLLGFARLTLPSDGISGFSFSGGRLDLSDPIALKAQVLLMELPAVAAALDSNLDAFDGIAATQFADNPLLVTTAVSPLKTSLLEAGGVIDKAAAAISTIAATAAAIPAAPDSAAFTPLTGQQFQLINSAIQTRSATTNVAPAVAGLSKASTVNQAFDQSSSSSLYDFSVRLSQPAPSGGALLLLSYQGSAVYGEDYSIKGYATRPKYVYVPAGETSLNLSIDVSTAVNPSSLLIQLQSASANYGISASFNRLLMEIEGSNAGGRAILREQVDNVQQITRNGASQLVGENLYDGIPRNNQSDVRTLVGSQPSLAKSPVEVNCYQSSLDSSIVRLSATTPSNKSISGEWLLIGHPFRAYAGDAGEVDVVELRDPTSGRFSYVSDAQQRQALLDQGWIDLGVAFSLDADRSLPVGIQTEAQKEFDLEVPGFDLTGASGYFDRYVFAPGQQISEWRFLANVDNVAFALDGKTYTLGGALTLREREEYGDQTLWLSADVNQFVLPSFGNTPSPITISDGRLALRIFDPKDDSAIKPATINQWQISGSVSNLPIYDLFSLNGSLDARYENSAATGNKPTYWLSAAVHDFDFTAGGLQLNDLDVTLTDLTIVSGSIKAWTIDAQVDSLAISDDLELSGSLNLNYSTSSSGVSRFQGSAEVNDFAFDLGSESVSIDNGSIAFDQVDGVLNSWQLSTSLPHLSLANGLLNLSGDGLFSYQLTNGVGLFNGAVEISQASLDLGSNLNIDLEQGKLALQAKDGDISSITGSSHINNADLGFLSLSDADASFSYSKTSGVSGASQRLNLALNNAHVELDLGDAIPELSSDDVDLNLDYENGSLLGYSLSANAISMQIGSGITITGSLKMSQETLVSGSTNSVRTYGSFNATSIDVNLPGVDFTAHGNVNFDLLNGKLQNLQMFAQVDDLPLAGVDINGFLDLKFSEFTDGAPGKVVVSGGVKDLDIGVPGNAGATLNGEVKDLTLRPERLNSFLAGGGDGTLEGGSTWGSWMVNGDAAVDTNNPSVYQLINGTNQSARVVHDQKIPASAWSNLVVEFTTNVSGNGTRADAFSFGVFDYNTSSITSGGGIGGAAGANGAAHSILFDYYQGQEIKVLNGTTQQAILNNAAVDGIHSWRLEYSGTDRTNLTLKVYKDDVLKLTTTGVTVPQNSRLMFGAGSGGSGSNVRISNFNVTGYGPMTGNYLPDAWEVYGSVDDFSIANLFTASGYARLAYKKLIQNEVLVSENLAGKVEVSHFSLNLPAGQQSASVNGSVAFDLDYLYHPNADTSTRMNWFSFKAGVSNLTVATGVTISGDLSIEYQDEDYKDNHSGQSRYLFSAALRNSSFEFAVSDSQSISLTLSEGSLSNMVLTDDGTLQSWKLQVVVSDLDLLGILSLSGKLLLEYSRASRSLSGSALVNNFALDLDGDGTDDLSNLSGGFSFGLKEDSSTGALKLSRWSINAKVQNFDAFGLFTLDGSLKVDAVLNKNNTNTDIYTINAKVDDFSFALSDTISYTLSGELRNLVIENTNSGKPFKDMIKSWTFISSDVSLDIAGFNLSGAAEISYTKSDSGVQTITLSSKVTAFSLPTTLTQASSMVSAAPLGQALVPTTPPTVSGSLKATLSGQGSASPSLTSWELSAFVSNLTLASNLTVNGSLSISYSQLSPAGASASSPYYQLDASFADLDLTLPGNHLLALSSGRLKVGFFESTTGGSIFNNPDVLDINATVSEFEITPTLSLSGAFSLSLKDDLYTINAKIASLTLPGMATGASFGGSLSNLQITDEGDVLAWNASAYLKNFNFFDIISFTGQIGVDYSNPLVGQETVSLTAKADKVRFALPGSDFDVTLSGSLALNVVDNQLDSLTLDASVEQLDFLGFELTGDLSFSYYKKNADFYNRQTISINQATVSADLLDGLVDVDLSVDRLLFAKLTTGWQAVAWKASASIAIDTTDFGGLPFELSGDLDLAYNYLDPIYNQSSLTISGAIDEFSFATSFLTVSQAQLDLNKLVLSAGVVRSVDLEGSIGSLKIADIIDLSGDFSVSYYTNSGQDTQGTLEFDGTLSDFKVRKGSVYKSIFDLLGIDDANVHATVSGDDITFSADVNFIPGSSFKLGDFQLGVDSGSATLNYSSITDDLSLNVAGRLLLGDSNAFPVEGSFKVGVNLDTGKVALQNASLLLTPDNTTLDLGLLKLQPGSLLSYVNDNGENQVSLQADVAVNTGFLDAAVTPIYDLINKNVSPALKPVIAGLTSTLPVDQMVIPETSITIPAVNIPEVYISGWRTGWFGVRLPIFSTRMHELIPAQTITILPRLDLGKAALGYFEDYAGAAYANDAKLEMIEVIDKVASVIFKVNQQLAKLGIGDAFAPFVNTFGPAAYTMEYPALAPFVKTADTLIKLAAQPRTLSNGLLDLDPILLNYDLDDDQFTLQGGGLEDLLSSLGGFGDLYNLVNHNPALTSPQPEPISQNVVGFIDRSELSFPLLDNPAKTLLDFILDKPIDLFEYNLNLAAGFDARAEVAIPGEVTVPLIGIPLPIVIGGNFGLGVGIDATLGYSAPTKGIKAVASEISTAITGGGLDLNKILEIMFDAATDPNSGGYLKLTDSMLSLDGHFSADLGLDYKVAGIRGQLGFGSTMFAGLSLVGPDQNLDRLYLNALLGSLFGGPAYADGKQANDLDLTLRLGNARVFTALQAKAGLSWITLLRLEGRIPTGSGGLTLKLGTIYTGPTFGSAEVYFDQDYNFAFNGSEARTYSGFREGTADQGDIYDRILNQILDQDVSGLLIVNPSEFARDVTTGISRSLSLFDSISPDDSLPDALTVITSLQSLPDLLRHNQDPTSTPITLDETYLSGITGFDDLVITAASSYQGLASSDADTRELALAQLSMEYRLQALLLATQDYLSHFQAGDLDLGSDFSALPQSDGLKPYLPLVFLALQLQGTGGLQLDLNDEDSLDAYFTSLNTLISGSVTASTSELSEAAGLSADLLADLNTRLDAIVTAVAPLEGPAEIPALALVELKRLMQAGAFSSFLDALQDQNATAAQLRTLFATSLDRPGSSQTDQTFATAGWAQQDGTAELVLSAPASDIGAALNLLVDTDLEYGVDYTINDLTQLPQALQVASGDESLALTIQRLRDIPTGMDGSIRLILLSGHSGIQVDSQSNTLEIAAADDSFSTSATDLTSAALGGLAGVNLIEADANGDFTVLADPAGQAQVLLGFDPLQGHHIVWQSSNQGSSPELQLVNGTLYADTTPVASVLSPIPGSSGWQPLAYVSDSVLRGTVSVETETTSVVNLVEDTAKSLSFATLLGAAVSGPFQVVAINSDGHLDLSHSGTLSTSTLDITPVGDFFGVASLLVTIDESGTQRSLRVPVSVAPQADAPRQLQTLSLSTNEDTPLKLDVASLCAAYLDADRFDLVRFVSLAEVPGQSGDGCEFKYKPEAGTVKITPPADFNGSRSLRLTVEADSGQYDFDFTLDVASVDDLPSGNQVPVLLNDNDLSIELTDNLHFKLSDADGPAFDPTVDGIRITVYPTAGELLYKATSGSTPEILNLHDQTLITIDQLNNGQLIYQHDGRTYDDELLNDVFQYVIVQDNGDVVSEPQVLTLLDFDKADLSAPPPDDSDVSTTPPDGPLAPFITVFQPTQDTSGFNFHFEFDQPLQREGGSLALYLASDPDNLDDLELITTVAGNDAAVVLAADGLSLDLALPLSQLTDLQGKQGYLFADLQSQGDVLRTSAGLSLVGDPLAYGLQVDFKAPELNGYSFINQADALLLELHFSEQVRSTGTLRLESLNPITGVVETIADLLPNSSPNPTGPDAPLSSDVLVDLSALVQNLTIMPGQRYRVVLDDDTGMADVNGNSDSYEQDFDLPFPTTEVFAEAKANALTAPTSPYHLYFGSPRLLSSAQSLPPVFPLEVMGFGKPDPSLVGKSFSLSNLDGELKSGKDYELGINLYPDAPAGNSEQVDTLLATASALRVTVQYAREEFWLDAQRITGGNLSSVTTTLLPGTNAAGQHLVELELLFERGDGWSVSQTADGNGKCLGALVIQPIPNESVSGLPDSFPSLLISAASLETGSGQHRGNRPLAVPPSPAPELSLPQLILTKTNTFPQTSQSGLLLLGSPHVSVMEDSGATSGLVEARSLAGLPASGALTVTQQPLKGTLVFDDSAGQWSYTPTANAYGTDSFEITVTGSDGRTASRSFNVDITNVNDAPVGSITAELTDRSGSTVSGRDPQQGDKLRSKGVGQLLDADGLANVDFQFTWLADGVPIPGATTKALTLKQAQVGKAIRLKVSYTDDGGTTETVRTTATAAVLNVNDKPTGRVAIVGKPSKPTSVLTASAAGLTDLDGFQEASISWSWYAKGSSDASPVAILDGQGQPITGSQFNFTPDLFDTLKGKVITVRASYTDDYSAQEISTGAFDTVLTSLATDPVRPPGISLTGTNGRDSLVGVDGDDTISGLASNDTLIGLKGDDLLDGGSGSDSIIGGDDLDTLLGSLGKDNLFGDGGGDLLDGGFDDDVLTGGSGLDSLLGGDGRDSIYGIGGADSLDGGSGTDLLVGGEKNDTLIGGLDDDKLFGNLDDDDLRGGLGRDLLSGGLGGDQLAGGADADTYKYDRLGESLLANFDVITGFVIGVDRIDTPVAVLAAQLRDNAGTVSSLAESDIQAVLTSSLFPAKAAAVFSYGGTRTFLAVNDRYAGFDAANDAIIEISGFSGDLSGLALI